MCFKQQETVRALMIARPLLITTETEALLDFLLAHSWGNMFNRAVARISVWNSVCCASTSCAIANAAVSDDGLARITSLRISGFSPAINIEINTGAGTLVTLFNSFSYALRYAPTVIKWCDDRCGVDPTCLAVWAWMARWMLPKVVLKDSGYHLRWQHGGFEWYLKLTCRRPPLQLLLLSLPPRPPSPRLHQLLLLKKKSKKHTASSPALSPELLGPPVPPNEALGPNVDRFSPAHELNDTSANGAVTTVTLRQPSTSGGTVTYEVNSFDLCVLLSSLLFDKTRYSRLGSPGLRTGSLSICLASPDGRVIGGGVGGVVIAASAVQVMLDGELCMYVFTGSKAKSKSPVYIEEQFNSMYKVQFHIDIDLERAEDYSFQHSRWFVSFRQKTKWYVCYVFKNTVENYIIIVITDLLTSLTPPSAPAARLTPSQKRGRGRPPGTGRKQQLASLGGWMSHSAGSGFTPHIITVAVGEDITTKIMSFLQQGPKAVCILSANGAVTTVTLRQPSTSGGTVTYEGQFEILSLSGSYLLSNSSGPQGLRTGSLSICLASPDGRVIGGGVGGVVIAASPVQVILGSFICVGSKAAKSKPPVSIEGAAAHLNRQSFDNSVSPSNMQHNQNLNWPLQ
nr:AT-hook motif nuclear-localized protein 9-like [Ipomoea batatas]